jgi:TonB family protein
MTTTALTYRHHAFGDRDDLFHRCLVGSAAVGALFLLVVMLAPIRHQVVTSIEQLPPRFARLIVEKPRPIESPGPISAAPKSPNPGGSGGGGSVEPRPGAPGPEPVAVVRPQAGPGPVSGPGNGATAGAMGRARAQAATSQLAGATASLERSLQNLSSSLQSTGAVAPVAGVGRRARAVRAGRSDGQLGTVRTDVGGGGTADLGGSAVAGTWVSVGALSGVGGGGGPGGSSGGGSGTGSGNGSGSGFGSGSGGGTGGGSGGGYGSGTGSGVGDGNGSGGGAAGPGVYRSNASLLAVIQRYAAGIQYCYSNELKRNPTLSGKLVVALTVAASGEVLDATLVQNTLGSERLASCALSQMRDWKFPPVPTGVTTFKAPFVFTPPN